MVYELELIYILYVYILYVFIGKQSAILIVQSVKTIFFESMGSTSLQEQLHIIPLLI